MYPTIGNAELQQHIKIKTKGTTSGFLRQQLMMLIWWVFFLITNQISVQRWLPIFVPMISENYSAEPHLV